MADREHGRYADGSGHLRDMTEETLGAQEQARQERQHRLEQQQSGGRADDESTYPELFDQGEDDYL
ncbi:hypothetical protein ACFYZE_22135 [Streptomyces sp. NPDC001796]|uniref:hypothetical protein n=1 Tax=Streptomyces sp. NPDC001796 TaxID=3364609 RepID=UPI0036CBBB65